MKGLHNYVDMAHAGIKTLLCLSFIFSVGEEVAASLSPEDVFLMLSKRMDYIIQETNNLKSELAETKSEVKSDLKVVVKRLENVEAKCSVLTLNTDFKEAEVSDMKDKIKRQSLAVHKMLATEKSLLRKMADRFETKITSFESDIKSQLSLMNASLASSVDGLVQVVNEDKVETNTSLMLMDSAFQNSLTEMDKQIEEVKRDIEEKSEDSLDKINEISQDILFRTRSEMKNAKRGFDSEIRTVSSHLASIKRKQESQEENFDEQISQLSSRISEEEAIKVAFSATQVTERSHYGKNEKIVFDDVKYSHGGGYSASTGIFTAPKSGTYLFTFNVQCRMEKKAHVVLMVEGIRKTSAIAADKGRNQITGGNAGIAYLRYGDKAWVQTRSLDDKYYIWPYRTTFNGILID